MVYTWSQQRYQGYRDALAEHGIAHDPVLVIRMDSLSPIYCLSS